MGKIKEIQTNVDSLGKGKIRTINSIEVIGVDGDKIVKCKNTNKKYKLIKPKNM